MRYFIKFIETESRVVVAMSWGKVGMESCCLTGTEVWFCTMKRVLEIGCTTM